MTLLVGADVGGSTTRVAVADENGTVLAVAQEGAGNPNAVGVSTSAERIRRAMEAALRQAQGAGQAALRQAQGAGQAALRQAQGAEQAALRQAQGAGSAVAAVVLGMAGYGTALAAGDEFRRACMPAGVSARPRIVSDLGVAFASGTPAPRGYVTIAGTGSSAAQIDRGEIVARRGGWGWLLGDEGGGFWLGREAVRHALAEVERGQARSPLTRRVLAELGPEARSDPGDLALLLRAPYQQSAVRLAELAPAVTELVDQDPAAVGIAARAADHLARLVLDLQPLPGLPIVTAGSVLQSNGPIRQAFATRLGQANGSVVLGATSGLVGALWLGHWTDSSGGTREQTVDQPLDPAVHRRLVATLPAAPVEHGRTS